MQAVSIACKIWKLHCAKNQNYVFHCFLNKRQIFAIHIALIRTAYGNYLAFYTWFDWFCSALSKKKIVAKATSFIFSVTCKTRSKNTQKASFTNNVNKYSFSTAWSSEATFLEISNQRIHALLKMKLKRVSCKATIVDVPKLRNFIFSSSFSFS